MMRVLLSHYSFATIGGAERVSIHLAAWLSNVLEMDVTIACYDAPDSSKLNKLLGIYAGVKVRFETIKPPGRCKLQLFRMAHLHREVKKMAGEYDLCISTYNEQDFGKPALQYVHHPIFESRELLRRYKIIPTENLVDKSILFEKIYYGLLNFYAGTNTLRRRNNVTMTNSEFMGDILAQCGYKNVEVLYPGLLDLSEFDPAAPKKNQIFSLGRIEPDKYTLELVSLYARLHAVAPDVKFIICGLTGSDAYLRQVKDEINRLGVPAELRLDLDRADVKQLISESAYYINPKPFEHFGIATVEAISAGCIPFLHNSGGNSELVKDKKLLYDTADELVTAFKWVTSNKEIRDVIIGELKDDLDRFSTATFFKDFHEIIRLFLNQSEPDAGSQKNIK